VELETVRIRLSTTSTMNITRKWLIKIDRPIAFSNHSCTILSPPANSMPSDYLTWPAVGSRVDRDESDQGVNNFTSYDQFVRQPRPWLIQTELRFVNGTRRTETKLICVAPDGVVGENRRPEGKWPPKSGGGGGFKMWTSDEILMIFALAAAVSLVI
jgi:hypothetical protein